jgi:enamine deaminase RidA (YjgF/YER057c/UK114 family)
MEKSSVNPTPWLSGFNMSHGVSVVGVQRILFLSGQTASGPDGAAQHPGDMAAQVKAAWGNIIDALTEAGMTSDNIVRLNMYVTDVDAFMAAAPAVMGLWASPSGAHPCGTLLGVSRLYDPAIMVELEVTAVA